MSYVLIYYNSSATAPQTDAIIKSKPVQLQTQTSPQQSSKFKENLILLTNT